MTDRTTKVSLRAEVEGYISGMQRSAAATREMAADSEAALAKQREAFDALGRASMTAGTIALASAALATKAAVDWESAWTGVTKTVEGTPEQLAAVESGLRGLARELPTSHAGIAAVAEAAGQLGIQTDNVVRFTKTMIDLGETTNLSADQAATELARFMNIMGTSQSDVDRLGAAVVELGNNFATTEAEIVEMGQRLAGAGKLAGLSEGEVLGLSTALRSVGVEAEAGGTAFSKLILNLDGAVDTGSEKLESFARVAGLSADEFAAKWNDKPGEALSAFIQGLAGAEAQGSSTAQVLEELGITEWRMRDALLRASLAADQFTGSMEMGNTAFEANTALLAEAEKRYATVESRMSKAGNAIVDASIDFGQVFLPVVGAAADAVADLADGFNEMDPVMQGVIAVSVVLGGTVAVTGGAFMLAVPKIAAYKAALATLGPVAQRTSAILGGLAKAAGLLVVVGVVGEIQKWQDAMRGATQTAEQFGKKLAVPAEAAQSLRDALTGGANFDFAGNKGFLNLNLLMTDMGQVAADMENSFVGTLQKIATLGMGTGSGLGNAKRNIEELDEAMAGLVTSGNADAAQRAFQQLVAQTDGSEESIRKLRDLLPQYSSAQSTAVAVTQDAADAYLAAADEVAALDDKLRRLIDQVNQANVVGQDAVTSNAAYRTALEGAREAVDEYVKEHGKSKAALDETTAAGAENAAMLADLASKSQTAAQRALENGASAREYSDALLQGRQEIYDTAMALTGSAEAAQRLTDKIYAMPSEKEINILIDEWRAQHVIDRFIAANDGRKIRINVDSLIRPGQVAAHAGGGTVGGVGGPKSDSNLILASRGEEIIQEPFASMFRRELKMMNRGMVPSFVSATPAVHQTMVVPQSGPTRIEGTLDLGNGLTGVIKGVIKDEVAAALPGGFGGK